MCSMGQQEAQAAQLIVRLRYQRMLHPSYGCSVVTAVPEQSGGNAVTHSNGRERGHALVLGTLLIVRTGLSRKLAGVWLRKKRQEE